ncbi:MAG: hypothetical protein D6762_01425 [Candidatus Neomarinimicrobiota bacterium]|nr:MAG: hypothetical protein D6762_01425 [Candidatus Neomarinimicrobiota bacterium]
MKKLWVGLALGLISLLPAQNQEKTLYLKSGEKITGTVKTETDSTVTLSTALGMITLRKDQIQPDRVTITLKNGDIVEGDLLQETPDSFVVRSGLGILTIPGDAIERVDFLRASEQQGRSGSNPERWYFSDERLIDLWFDPTGFPLEKNVFYISGFSAAYGFSDRFQVSTRWASWVVGDLNFRPKWMVLKTGGIQKMQALSIGGHFHQRGLPELKWRRESWQEWNRWAEYDQAGNFLSGDTSRNPETQTMWLRIGEDFSLVSFQDTLYLPDGNYQVTSGQYADYSSDFGPFTSGNKPWEELFIAYTLSKLKTSGQGRINYNLGASFIFYPGEPVLSRYYAGLDYDARPNLKLIFSVFYDEHYIPIYMDAGRDTHFGPVFTDVGFIYAKDEHWRFGLHFQRPTIALYYKF